MSQEYLHQNPDATVAEPLSNTAPGDAIALRARRPDEDAGFVLARRVAAASVPERPAAGEAVVTPDATVCCDRGRRIRRPDDATESRRKAAEHGWRTG